MSFQDELEKRIRGRDLERLGRAVHPRILARLSILDCPWHETPREAEKSTILNRRKEAQLEWVKGQMYVRLTKLERTCINLHYFQDLSLRDAAILLNTNRSSVHRAVQRGIRKLQSAARRSRIWGPG